ncbi:MAG: hypothetical protein H0W58_15095 [Acidobacteria bacterium]|nr:hypothetical protein [Acidobacteriota bacterium]
MKNNFLRLSLFLLLLSFPVFVKTDELKVDQPNNDFWFYELELKRTK